MLKVMIHGHKIRYENYSFDAIKSSIDAKAPVLIRGYGIDPKPTTPSALSNSSEGVKFGHAWVIDGYCNLSCIARHTETRERKLITADYVHCNIGWGEKEMVILSAIFLHLDLTSLLQVMVK